MSKLIRSQREYLLPRVSLQALQKTHEKLHEEVRASTDLKARNLARKIIGRLVNFKITKITFDHEKFEPVILSGDAIKAITVTGFTPNYDINMVFAWARNPDGLTWKPQKYTKYEISLLNSLAEVLEWWYNATGGTTFTV